MLLASTERSLETLRNFVEATMQTYSHGQAQVKHLRLRTCHWTQRLKTLPTARTRQPPHKTVMGMATRITWDFAPATGRKVSNHCQQRARDGRHTKHSQAYANESPETSHPRLDAESQAIADNAHEAPCAESHTVTAPNLGAAEPAKHRLRRQPSTTHSCTLHHSSCNNRMTYCTLSFVDRSRDLEETVAISLRW